MEQIKLIKIVMICHFSNQYVRSKLSFSERRIYHSIRKLLGKPEIPKEIYDFAPWVSNIIEDFKKHSEIELHVISPHLGLSGHYYNFQECNIHFHFFNSSNILILRKIISNTKIWLKFNPLIKWVHRIVNKVKPDIVLLVGAENDYYSSTVLGIKDYPVYILCQTIYNNPERYLYSTIDNKRLSCEKIIFEKYNYFGVYCKKHYDLLNKLIDNGTILKYGYPVNSKLLEPTQCKKEYDFVNFALSMSDSKGFTDIIHALKIVKNQYPDIKLNLVGKGNKEHLLQLIEKYKLHNNVIFTPFFEKQSDLFIHIQKSRFAVLPCKLDNISGTMMQSMQLELPLVVYETTGTPSLNVKKECVLIAENKNIEDLASQMLFLLNNPEKAELLKKNAREFQKDMYDYEKGNGDRLIANIKAIINNFNHNIPIPKNQLFNPEIDK